jgi:hypothetical protein
MTKSTASSQHQKQRMTFQAQTTFPTMTTTTTTALALSLLLLLSASVQAFTPSHLAARHSLSPLLSWSSTSSRSLSPIIATTRSNFALQSSLSRSGDGSDGANEVRESPPPGYGLSAPVQRILQQTRGSKGYAQVAASSPVVRVMDEITIAGQDVALVYQQESAPPGKDNPLVGIFTESDYIQVSTVSYCFVHYYCMLLLLHECYTAAVVSTDITACFMSKSHVFPSLTFYSSHHYYSLPTPYTVCHTTVEHGRRMSAAT